MLLTLLLKGNAFFKMGNIGEKQVGSQDDMSCLACDKLEVPEAYSSRDLDTLSWRTDRRAEQAADVGLEVTSLYGWRLARRIDSSREKGRMRGLSSHTIP